MNDSSDDGDLIWLGCAIGCIGSLAALSVLFAVAFWIW